MKLIGDMISKKVELSEEKLISRNYKRYIWEFYIAYNIARAVLQHYDPNIKAKIRIYRKFFLSKENIDSKTYKKLQVFIRKDTNVIIRAFRMIERAKEEAGFEFGEYYRPFTLGILSADYPEE